MTRRLAFDFKADAASATPLYLQLFERLAKHIRDGGYRSNEALPSERSLAERLGLSRVTARKAIDRLAEQGLIVRRHGSGNYIAPQLEQPLTRLTSFSEELRQRGFLPSSRWLKRACTAASSDEQLSLALSPGARVARLERLRLADGTVMAYEVSVLPESVLPDPGSVQGSLYERLTELKRVPARALQHMRAQNATARQAELLGVPPGQALLHLTRVGYLASGTPVELTHSYCRSDLYGFVIEMKR